MGGRRRRWLRHRTLEAEMKSTLVREIESLILAHRFRDSELVAGRFGITDAQYREIFERMIPELDRTMEGWK
jgi:hypothetical protein